MKQKLFYLVFLFFLNFFYAQQNEEFKKVKNYFDHQKVLLNITFKEKFEAENENEIKIEIRQHFEYFMVKMDSIENTAFIGALVSVKNREDLGLKANNTDENALLNQSSINEKNAEYPGGIANLREQVARIFYFDSVISEEKSLKAEVIFVVEKDGSVAFVHAEGDNVLFNRQAEIAIYLLPEKFSPAIVNGNAVRHRFKLPLAMDFK